MQLRNKRHVIETSLLVQSQQSGKLRKAITVNIFPQDKLDHDLNKKGFISRLYFVHLSYTEHCSFRKLPYLILFEEATQRRDRSCQT